MKQMRIDEEVFRNLPTFEHRHNHIGELFLLDKSIKQHQESRSVYVGIVTEHEDDDFLDVVEVQVI